MVNETFYIALCVTILLLGIVYWFWTQVQYIQRKVNLLDNVVYEIKTLMSNLPGPESGPRLVKNEESSKRDSQEFIPATLQESYAPPPESIAGDLEAERNASEEEFDNFSGSLQMKPIPEEPKPSEVPDELQPGGLAQAATGGGETKNVKVESDSSIESPLSSLGLKDLRRMAEAQGIPGFNELKKKDLIRALRDKVSGIINNNESQGQAEPQIISFDMIDAPTLE